MKKKIVIISIVLMAFAGALAGNSWAARERGGDRHMDRGHRFRDVDDSVGDKLRRVRVRDRGHRFRDANDSVRDNFRRVRVRDRGPGHFPRRDFNRPLPRFKHKYNKWNQYQRAHRFKHKYYKRHHYRASHRFGPKYRHWRHRPIYRQGHPWHLKWRHRH